LSRPAVDTVVNTPEASLSPDFSGGGADRLRAGRSRAWPRS
jgi:hypothetical protein